MKAKMKKLLTIVLVCSAVACKKETSVSSSTSSDSTTSSSSSTTYYYQSGSTVTQTGKTYYSTISDTGGVEVTNSGTYTLSDSRIWSSGSTTSTDSSSFYGLNACVLATGGATITLSNDSISTSGISGNGVYSYGSSTVTLSTDTINCTGSGGGVLKATDVIAATTGSSASVIATDRGGGTITVSGGSYTSGGSNSADVYSTGTITVTGATLTATGAEAVVVEGANNATLTNCTTKVTYDKWGALIYQSTSGDASGTVGTLTITGGSYTYTGTSGGLFYNTNDSAYIYLNDVTIANSCDTLLRSMEGGWGNSSTASSGGNTRLTCDDQTISGLIYIDGSSEATLKLTDGSAFSGSINPGDVAKVAAVVIDASSTWTLTGNTYLTSLTDATTSYSNITANGYKLYVNGTEVL
jgi:hypothetical protein